ncbi:MAG TPA: DUF2568 domain-containing protein [Streptosporangiaceae bacterium]|nr:DUF2568 domain-containing protein [Streptosporangiaceae bacterium]
MLRSANLAVKFLLELAAFAALAYWGASTGHGAVRVLLAIAAPAAAVLAVIFGAVAVANSVLLTTTHQWEQ